MNSAFQSWGREMLGSAFDTLDSDQLASLHANYSGRHEATTADVSAVAPLIQASGMELDDEELRLRRVERSLAREERIKKLEASIPMATTVSSGRRMAADATVIEAALCLAGGLSKPEDHFSDQVLNAADRASRGLGLQSLLMTAACGNGYQARPGEYVTDGNLRRVLQAAFAADIKASGFSTLDISNVVSNTANKFLLDGFNEIEDPWQQIASVKNVRNFKQATFVRLLDSLEFEQVGNAGEIKHGTLGDDTMTVQANTYAKMLSITRTDIINDDLGALTDVPRRLGRAAMMKFRRLFWTAFTASDGFFASGNGNIVGTGDERLSEAGLTTALQAFRAQSSPAADGAKLIGGKPAVLLCPPALEIAARRQLNSSNIVSGTDGMIPSGNPFQGLCELAVGDFLSTAQGGNDAYWYLFRSPALAPAMLVAALNGRVEPTVETSQADFNVLGIEMRGYNDVGFARGEKLCGLLLDGTSS